MSSNNTKPPQRGTDEEQRIAYTWSLFGDTRAQSVTLGAILVFGVLILGLGVYQAYAVPQQNEEVEFKHNLQVQEGMQQVRNNIMTMGLSGEGTSSELTLGTTYPTRMVAINPPPASGQLKTETFSSQMAIRNAIALDEETNDYWELADLEFNTKRLTYSPNYHVYSNAPSTVFENSVVYNAFESSSNDVTITGQGLVNGRTLTLVALTGELSTSRSDSMTINIQPASAPARTVPIKGDGGPITIELPTELSEGAWQQLLEEEETGGHIIDGSIEVDSGVLSFDLDGSVTYNARMAKVGVGKNIGSEPEHYATVVEGDEQSIGEEARHRIVVEVRDQFNNPVSGVEVDFFIEDAQLYDSLSTDSTGPTSPQLNDVVTNGEGRAVVTFTPENVNSAKEKTIRASFDSDVSASSFDPGEKENVVAEVDVVDSDNSGNDVGEGINPSDQFVWQSVTCLGPCDKNQGGDSMDVTFKNEDSDTITVESVRINYYHMADAQGRSRSTPPPARVETDFTTPPEFDIAASYVNVDPAEGEVDAGDTVTYNFDFLEADSTEFDEDIYDYIVITLRFDNGRSSLYFISPQGG